ncbi:MAG: GTPase Era [Rhodothermales bacterium]
MSDESPALPDDLPDAEPDAAEQATDATPELPDAEPAFAFDPATHRSGYVALVGPPNVGKSTLMNALVGQKLSIVTAKPSTTRHRVLGILSGDDYQVVFLDTPGIVRPQYRLHDAMMHAVDFAVADADVLLFMVDASHHGVPDKALEKIAERPALLLLNKIDLIAQEEALPLVERFTALRAFDAVIPISAQKGFNLDTLLEQILQRLPQGPPYYPKDQLSEHPERFFVSEIIREKIFDLYREEIPYSTQVNIVTYEERPGNKDFIDAEIVVERDTQKGIIIGKGGSGLKRLGQTARRDIEAFVGKPVYLQLHVKARADWRNREGFLRSYGYNV